MDSSWQREHQQTMRPDHSDEEEGYESEDEEEEEEGEEEEERVEGVQEDRGRKKGKQDDVSSSGHGEVMRQESEEQKKKQQQRKKRKSRWGPEIGEEGEKTLTVRKRKSRWGDPQDHASPSSLQDIVKLMAQTKDPHLQALNARLAEIDNRLRTGDVLDGKIHSQRSPSPEPLYDNFGHRISTRKIKAVKELHQEKLDIYATFAKKLPGLTEQARRDIFTILGRSVPRFKELAQKKIYVPVKAYPNYNFVGLILGPRGNTQKRMEAESGARIMLRGKGSHKADKLQEKHGLKADPFDDDDLHVLIEAETEEAVEKASRMVEKLLVPLEDKENEHKQAQLRELASIAKTHALASIVKKDEDTCKLCGEVGHQQNSCPCLLSELASSVKKEEVTCKLCGELGHQQKSCPFLCRLCGDGRHAILECPKIQASKVDIGPLSSMGDVLCQMCGVIGHLTLDCPKMGAILRITLVGSETNSLVGTESDNAGPSSVLTSKGNFIKNDILCRLCGNGGHSTSDCPNLGPSQGTQVDDMHQLSQSTLKMEVLCRICGDGRHSTVNCPTLGPSPDLISKSNAFCRICGGSSHSTISCPAMVSPEGKRINSDYERFLAEHRSVYDSSHRWLNSLNSQTGSTLDLPELKLDRTPLSGYSSIVPQSGMESPSMREREMVGGAHDFDLLRSSEKSSFYDGHGHTSSASGPVRQKATGSCTVQLIVENLPTRVDDEVLVRLFSRFGTIYDARVIKDSQTEIGKAYGVVSYVNPTCATEAVETMNGCRLESKILTVRVVNQPHSASSGTVLNASPLPGNDVLVGRDYPQHQQSAQLPWEQTSKSLPGSVYYRNDADDIPSSYNLYGSSFQNTSGSRILADQRRVPASTSTFLHESGTAGFSCDSPNLMPRPYGGPPDNMPRLYGGPLDDMPRQSGRSVCSEFPHYSTLSHSPSFKATPSDHLPTISSGLSSTTNKAPSPRPLNSKMLSSASVAKHRSKEGNTMESEYERFISELDL